MDRPSSSTQGAHVNGRDTEGRTPKGACPQPDWTPLMDAAMNGKTATADLLVEHGADVYSTIPGGESPLFYAESAGDNALATFLVERGARL